MALGAAVAAAGRACDAGVIAGACWHSVPAVLWHSVLHCCDRFLAFDAASVALSISDALAARVIPGTRVPVAAAVALRISGWAFRMLLLQR